MTDRPSNAVGLGCAIALVAVSAIGIAGGLVYAALSAWQVIR